MLALNWQDYVWSPEGLVILVSAVIGAIVVPQLAKKWAAQADALPERGEGETLVLRAAPASRVTYLALAIVTAVGAVAIALVLGLHMPSWFLGVAWSVVILLGIVSALSLIPITEQIELADAHIRRRHLFSAWKTIPWQDVVRAEYQIYHQRFQVNDAGGLVIRVSRWMPGHRQFLKLASFCVPEDAIGPDWHKHVPDYLAESEDERG